MPAGSLQLERIDPSTRAESLAVTGVGWLQAALTPPPAGEF